LYYEIYIDSLFFMDLIMNFYVIGLTGKWLGRTVTCLRRLAGAAYGAGIFCMTFWVPIGELLGKFIIGGISAFVGMAWIAFSSTGFHAYIKNFAAMLGAAFYMGGIYLFLLERFLLFSNLKDNIFFQLFFGFAAYLSGSFLFEKSRRKNVSFCRVILQNEDKKINVRALIDTGNSLVEPLSNKPVSILDEKSLKELFGGELPEFYRVVPFSSIGKKKGILKCFEIPKIWVEYQEEKRVYEKIFVACSDEFVASERCHMILNPRLIKNQEAKEYDI